MSARGSLAAAIAAAVAVAGLTLRAGSGQTAAPPAGAPTFTRDVAPILYKHCTDCHRPGEAEPSLLTYRDTRPWARAVRNKVTSREMPPWHADPQHGRFRNARGMTDEEIETILAWTQGGSQEGDPDHLPPAPDYVEGWNIGTPDVVLAMEEPFDVPADGTVDSRYVEVPTGFTDDTWIQGIEVRPERRDLVHRVVVYVREPGAPPRPPVIQPAASMVPPPPAAGPGGAARPLGEPLVFTGIGTDPTIYPEGAARRIGAGAVLTFEIQYVTIGVPGSDRTSVGLKFAGGAPEVEVRSAFIADAGFTIPPGASSHEVDAEVTFTEDVRILSLLPHAHQRGSSFEYRVLHPDGRSEVVLSVPKYDFVWQTDYQFEEPLRLPKGARLLALARYDNSSDNQDNPDPTAEVRWGGQPWEEMMLTAVTYSVGVGPSRARGDE